MKGDRRKMSAPPIDARKDRDEDLLLFLEMRRREKDRAINLLQPFSDDQFEQSSGNGNYPLFRIPSAKKGTANDFLDIYSGKNDYDWLKTPPATPLFPSLEMEAAGPDFVVQREIPVLQPIRYSRFSGKSEEAPKDSKHATTDTKSVKNPKSATPSPKRSGWAKHPSTTEKTLKSSPNRSKTPTPSSISSKAINPKEIPTKTDAIANTQKQKANVPDPKPKEISAKTPKQKTNVSDSKPKSRGVSPLAKSRIPAMIPGFSDETPPNLRTSVPDRPLSAMRGRPTRTMADMKQDTEKQSRQSCSPSVTRGRKPEFGREAKVAAAAGNGSLVLGSRMVEKVMNARKSVGTDGKEQKPRQWVSSSERPTFGMMMSRSSLDVALKHMEIKRTPINFQHYNNISANKSSATSSNSSLNSSINSSPRGTHEEDR